MTIAKFPDVETHLWDEENEFILFVTAKNPERCATPEWFAANRAEIRAALDRYGAFYFRGFPVDSRMFESMMEALTEDPIPYLGGVSPRSLVHGTVYTASDAPPDLPIVQHHEMSYHSYTPHYVCFYCVTASGEGGNTPLSDGRRFGRTMEKEAPEILDELEKKGALFVRNYNDANFKGWRQTWHTDDRAELEEKLRDAKAEWEWITPEWLRTRQKVPAIRRDPLSGARVLYASIHLWHRSFVKKMNKSTGIPLPEDPEMQPYATFFGDGSPIPEDFIDLMLRTYDEQKIVIPYEEADFMVAQNFLTAHGRQTYVPPRKVVVMLRERVQMTDPAFSQPQ